MLRGTDWPLIGGSFTTREIHVVWPKKLVPLLQAEGPFDAEVVDSTYRLLASKLPPA